jgi:cytochrome P450
MTGTTSPATTRERVRRLGGAACDVLAIPRRFEAPPAGSGLRHVHGGRGLPVVGHFPTMYVDPIGWARRRFNRYGAVSPLNLAVKRGIVALGPDATAEILVNKDKAFASGWSLMFEPLLPRGILLLDFEEHLHHRRILQQAFTRTRLDAYLQAMMPTIDGEISRWETGAGFQIFPASKKLMLDLVAEFVVGTSLDPEADRVRDAFVRLANAAQTPLRVNVPGGTWARGLKARRFLEDFIRTRLADNRTGAGDDLFSALCDAQTEDGEHFSDQDVVKHMIFVPAVAHDTATLTMSTMCYYLAKHPEWQERVRAESVALRGGTLHYGDMDSLVSLDLVMKEATRLVAPVPMLMRETVVDTELAGFFVPKNTFTLVMPHFNHHMGEYWPDPERFDPERFAPDRHEDKIHKYAWAPFGGGAHKCIGMFFAGMEIKAVLHQMLLNFEWSVDPGYQAKFDLHRLFVPKDGLAVRLRRR